MNERQERLCRRDLKIFAEYLQARRQHKESTMGEVCDRVAEVVFLSPKYVAKIVRKQIKTPHANLQVKMMMEC